MYKRPTDPSNIGDILADGFMLYRASIRSLFVPVFWLGLVIGLIHWGQVPFSGSEEETSLGLGFWLRSLVSLVASVYLYGIVIAIVHFIASGSPRGVRSPVTIATHRFPTLLAVSVLCALAIVIGPILIVVPLALLGPLGIAVAMPLMLVPVFFLAVALFASPILVVAEGHGPADSIRESYALVKGRWWPTFAFFVFATVISTAISFAGNGINLLLADLFEIATLSNTVSTLAYAALTAIIWPIGICLIYGAYQDLRLRQNDVALSS